MGTLTLGFRLDNALAAQFKRATESDIAFAVGGEIRASTLPSADRARLQPLLSAEDVQTVPLESGEYVALRRPLALEADANPGQGAPWVLLLRSRTERLRFLDAIRTALASVAVVAVFAATILSYAVARTITRPLATITDAMREMTATGDLTRKIRLGGATRWEDEDAKLLATTFNTLTDSIERFQREGAQRERLSALGRLSTVIAHEIRNPLMIIKASLRTLARDTVSRDDIRQAMKDVDEEVSRLNRVVNDVLDFARPINFQLAPADLNALCVEAEQATRAAAPETTAVVRLDPALRPVVTDAERLRTALVNILTNARHAAAGRARGPGSTQLTPDIEVETSASPLHIAIRDRGMGVRPDDMPRVFDPYFTTKRTGTGLGLAIAKNIIEGLGGSLAMESQPGTGTVIRIELPGTAAQKADQREERHGEVRT